MKTRRNLTGQSFGKWTVLSTAPDRGARVHWGCRCECGTERAVSYSNLVYGVSTSCGCSKRTHGHTLMGIRSPTMRCYVSMLARCTQPSNPAFLHYQKRGISLCARWHFGDGVLNGFECFLADMGERPGRMTIERIDNDKGYEPGNCRWATRREQARNRSTTVFYDYAGESLTLRELSEKYLIRYDTLLYRIKRRKISVASAIRQGPDKQYRLSP